MKYRELSIIKQVVRWSWLRFILTFIFLLVMLPAAVSIVIYYIESKAFIMSDAILLSLSTTIGAPYKPNAALSVSDISQLFLVILRFYGYIWFGFFTALLIARIGENRNKARLANRCAVYFHDGSGFLDERPSRYLLEFRLIVFPYPPILKPDITVTLHLANESNERDQIPLELTPMQANEVKVYLTFRAILPRDCLILPDENHLEESRKLPEGTVDVCINMIDSYSDKNVYVYKTYRLPHDAKTGKFKDAVTLGEHHVIDKVLPDSFEVIEKA
ncbi:hypothetical protein [Desulfobotulus mexicanus]|uniref:Uncharacterized protein n=1 Tax=Desulfobotulus mexicanus TaxID=2586642 RepID=A0A5Q4VEY1_9BACT|nr:hypothetical protein [Desulfobotulus mexicanus]TYT75528.1 hypothetical protein FIM25_03550 [Desulfobotulus mexicanus]